MSNEYLDSLIVILQNYFTYRAISIWDLEGKCQFATDIYCKYLNIKDVRGKKMGEMNEDLRVYQDEFHNKVIHMVLTNKKPILAYFMNRSKDGDNYQIYLVASSPLIKNSEVIGFMSDIQLIDNAPLYNQLLGALAFKSNHAHSFMTNRSNKLTRREHIILFLLMIGKGHKEIAITLSEIFERTILSNTVSSIISKQIYNKLEVHDNSSLVQAAFKMGVLYNIPHELASRLPRIVIVAKDINFENLTSTRTHL